jgi:hypothetical protein
VLAYVAYALPPLTREERASKAKVEISTHFSSKQQVFLDFVLSHYVTSGVDELSREKLNPLLRLKYRDSLRMRSWIWANLHRSAKPLRAFRNICTTRAWLSAE